MTVQVDANGAKQGDRWLLAIDGGGSKVAGRLVSVQGAADSQGDAVSSAARFAQSFEFSLHGVGSAAPKLWPAAIENVAAVVKELLRQAGIEANSVAAATFMLAGAGRSEDVERVSRSMREDPQLKLLRTFLVTTDIHPLLEFAQRITPRQPSIVVIAGTGSLVAATDAAGKLLRAGGWGPTLGDVGSGWGIAQAALKCVCDWVDRTGNDSAQPDATDPRLVAVVKRFLLDAQLFTPEHEAVSSGLIRLANDRQLAAQLTPRLLELSESDELTREVVESQIRGLADQIAAVHRRLELSGSAWRLCMTGGLARNNLHWRSRILERLAELGCAPLSTTAAAQLLEPLEAALAVMVSRLVATGSTSEANE